MNCEADGKTKSKESKHTGRPLRNMNGMERNDNEVERSLALVQASEHLGF